MRKLIVLLVALATSACTQVIVPHSGGQTYNPFLQNVVVNVVNNCAEFLDIETPRRRIITGLPYGESFTVYLQREPFVSQTGVNLQLTVKARKGDTYMGSSSRSFYVDVWQSGQEVTWEVSSVNLPNGSGGCRT